MSDEQEVRLKCLAMAHQWAATRIFLDEPGGLTTDRVIALAARLDGFVMGAGVTDEGADSGNTRLRVASCFVCGHRWNPQEEGVYHNVPGYRGALVLSCPKCGAGHSSVQAPSPPVSA